MIGERSFRKSDILVSKTDFYGWVNELITSHTVIGPAVNERGQTLFRKISSSRELNMDYDSTMVPPVKLFLKRFRENIVKFSMGEGIAVEEISETYERNIFLGIHSCDLYAVFYLDAHMRHSFRDSGYKARRENTLLIAANCSDVSPYCFCSSVGTGPQVKAETGYDMLLTDFGDEYLVEAKSRRFADLPPMKGKKPNDGIYGAKTEKEQNLLQKFQRHIEIRGLDEIYLKNLDHPIWTETAESRCLSCSNCVMVCPTCFCYDIFDEVSMDLKEVRRFRQLDACQDFLFAGIHGGNFRRTRASRLRQFQMHNLNYSSQYGMTKTVGCGRCIKWCPTNIDLTAVANEIRRNPLG